VALVDRHQKAVYRIASTMCAGPDEILRVMERTFLSAYRTIMSTQTIPGFRTFLYRIAMDVVRARRPRSTSRKNGVLRDSLEWLDHDARAAFVLCDLLELPIDDAAAVLRSSRHSTVECAHRARLFLCRWFESQMQQ
jgi:DNA-directed RNA polymerase specialized sigma24 family protein